MMAEAFGPDARHRNSGSLGDYDSDRGRVVVRASAWGELDVTQLELDVWLDRAGAITGKGSR